MKPEIDRSDLTKALAELGQPSSDFDLNAPERRSDHGALKPAGVLAAFRDVGGRTTLTLTKRASHLAHHPGQVAFPGGRMDEGDRDVVDAALREAHEEIGLPRDAVDVLGCMPPHETVSNYSMTPVLGWIRDDFDPILDPGEVAEVFEVPAAEVLDPAKFTIHARRWRGSMRSYYTVPYGPYYIWGATARVLHALAMRLAQ